MFQYIYILLWCIPIVWFGTKVVWYFTSMFEAKRFGASQRLPYISIYTICDSALFWQFSPYFAPFIEALPFGWGNWVKYVKKVYLQKRKGKKEETGGSFKLHLEEEIANSPPRRIGLSMGPQRRHLSRIGK
jgi:hypothetical protein